MRNQVSLTNALMGLMLVCIHFLSSRDGSELLVLGVFLLTLAWKQFERAGFIGLLQEVNKYVDSPR